jgi:hypothetical protein
MSRSPATSRSTSPPIPDSSLSSLAISLFTNSDSGMWLIERCRPRGIHWPLPRYSIFHSSLDGLQRVANSNREHLFRAPRCGVGVLRALCSLGFPRR